MHEEMCDAVDYRALSCGTYSLMQEEAMISFTLI